MVDPAYPLCEEAPQAPRRVKPRGGFALFRVHSEPQAPGYCHDRLRHGPARIRGVVPARQRHRFPAHDDPGTAREGPEGPLMGRGP
jgi:hypothetical protein